jgi:hypothetical protein
MTRDDIIRMAYEADCLDDQHYGTVWANKLERFAALVAAAEREACADCLNFHGEDEALRYLEWKWGNGRSKGSI